MERSILESLWENVAKWVAMGLAVAGSFWALVRAWWDSRFRSIHKRIDGVEERVSATESKHNKHNERLADHENNIGQLNVHVKHIKDNSDEIKKSINRIHDKLDKVVGR